MAALLMKSDQAETLVSTLKSVMLKALQVFQLPQSWRTHSRLCDSIPVPWGVGRSLREGTRACEPLQSLTSQPHVNSASGGQLFSQPLPNLTVRLRNGGGGSLWEIVSSRMFLKTMDLHPVFKGNSFDVSHLSCLSPRSCALPWNLHQTPKVPLRN